MTTKIMDGVRVIEVAEQAFVPTATAAFAEWGADVIKIEHAERGDAMRGLGKTGVINLGNGPHVLLEHSNRGKRSLGLDLSKPEGLEVFYRLCEQADVVFVNKVEAVRQKLKIDVEDVRARNPKLIYAIGTGWGTKGPDANKGGYDMTSFWCRSGIALACTPYGFEHGVMGQPGPAFGDSTAGLHLAGAVAAALFHRERTGEALTVDVSLLAAGIWQLSATIALSQLLQMPWLQTKAGPAGLANPLVATYRTKDDRFLCLNMLQAGQYWGVTCQWLGRPELAEDPRFDSHEKLAENTEAAKQELRQVIASKTLDEWCDQLSDFPGQWTPVLNSLEVAQDAQVVANGYIQDLEKDGQSFKLCTFPAQFDGEAAELKRAPDFNEHGDEILGDVLGLDTEAIIELKVKGAVA